MQCRYNAVNFVQNPHNKNNLTSLRGRGMGYFVSTNSSLSFAWVTAVLHATKCYIGPRYNGSHLYTIIILKAVPSRWNSSPVITNMTWYWRCMYLKAVLDSILLISVMSDFEIYTLLLQCLNRLFITAYNLSRDEWYLNHIWRKFTHN